MAKGFGDRLLVEDMSFLLPPGGIVGVIGPNGAGKTTLFRMIVGTEAPDAGDAAHRRRPSELGLCRPVPRRRSTAANTVFEEVAGGQDRIVVGGRELHGRAYVASFGFKGSDQQKKVGDLSGGERNRVHLAKVLRSGGNVLLLDEPTNDLDVDTLRALEDALLAFPGCAVVISHDRWFLDRVATHVLAFEGDSQVRVVGGQLLRLRGRPPPAARHRGRPAAPHQVQAGANGALAGRVRTWRPGRGRPSNSRRNSAPPAAWPPPRSS